MVDPNPVPPECLNCGHEWETTTWVHSPVGWKWYKKSQNLVQCEGCHQIIDLDEYEVL